MLLPWGSAVLPQSGDAELAWVAPLDLTGAIRRATLSLANVLAGKAARRFYEVRLGYLLSDRGSVQPFALGSPEVCAAPLLDGAGVTRPLGGCLGDPSVAVALEARHRGASCGRDACPPLARVLAARVRGDALVLSSIETSIERSSPKPGSVPHPAASSHEIGRIGVPVGARARLLGLGVRRSEPVLVAIDADGETILAPIDDERGTLGPEEPLASLRSAILASDPSCESKAPDEARILVSFEGEIGLAGDALPGVASAGSQGFVVARWSRDRVCLDALEIPVHDERFESDPGGYEPPGTVRKIVVAPRDSNARSLDASLLEIGNGFEIRQPLRCQRGGS
jgi:hypothetical protein